jgi:glutathione synthase/RimK-type ligase-like ATP-grasp enzyme
MNYIIIHKFGIPSIKAIMNLMDVDCTLLKGREQINRTRFNSGDKIIRWATQLQFNTNHAKIFNLSKGIVNASNKAKARQIFQENNVSCPITWFDDYTIQYPVIARPSHHRKGEQFFIIENQRQMNIYGNIDFYYSQIIDKTNEYRVHVGHGKVLLIHEKPLLEGEIRANQHITGLSWGNVLRWEDYRKNLCKLACDAVKVLGLDMGAVDIIKDRENNYYVLEVNTAPTLNDSPYSCQRYAKYFDWIFKNDNPQWWDYTQWEAGKSFAWKNNQL